MSLASPRSAEKRTSGNASIRHIISLHENQITRVNRQSSERTPRKTGENADTLTPPRGAVSLPLGIIRFTASLVLVSFRQRRAKRVRAEEEVFLRRALPGGSPAMAPAICDPSTSDAPGAGSTGCLLLYKTCVSRNVNCAWLLPITPRLGGNGGRAR